MQTSAKAARILATAFLSLAVAGNLFLRGRAVAKPSFIFSRKLLRKIRDDEAAVTAFSSFGYSLKATWDDGLGSFLFDLRREIHPAAIGYTGPSDVPDASIQTDRLAEGSDESVIIGSPGPDAMHTARVFYEITVTPEALERCKGGGQIMGINHESHYTLIWNAETGNFVIRVYDGKMKWKSVALGSDGEFHPVGSFTPERGAVKATQFGVHPQVGKLLLDGLKRIRDSVRRVSDINGLSAPSAREWAYDEMLALIAEAERSGFPVPAYLVETLDNPDKLAQAIKASEMENVHFSTMFDRLDEVARLIESEALAAWSARMRRWFGRLIEECEAARKWRLPTLAECEDDPEATRVWNAVHKTEME